jgi:hypothetical protein
MGKSKKTAGNKDKPLPKCKAILLCDTVIVDSRSGKVSIIGILDGFNVIQFPGRIAPFHVFLQLTDGIGKYRVSVEIHDLRDDKIVVRAPLVEIDFRARPGKGNLIIPIPPLPLQHEGGYDFVVLADGQEIDRQQFRARLVRRRGNPP